jgi:nickel superoxide dismutase
MKGVQVMKKKYLVMLLVVALILPGARYALSHCEIPCGIYDDQMRIRMIAEHITTIEKSMKEIRRLATEHPANNNQIVRWVVNKENHANKLQEVVTQYFMTQRIKLDTANYAKKVTLLHKMLVYAMKCKQTTDVAHVGMLRSLLKDFETLYFGKDK